MALEEYRAKRDFRKTEEPGPHTEKGHKRPIFVIQEHHATRLHYDFRLEADGVLKSWAVPREPSLDPSVKRLAVHVEDHPLAYAKFRGRIPAGQYGAGIVKIWDHGTYDNRSDTPITEGIERGRLEVELYGKKLRGAFALVRMEGRSRPGKENWLLIKMKDEHARRDEPGETNDAAKPPRRRQAARPVTGIGKPQPGDFSISNPEKVMFPDAGITKAELLDYYRRIAPKLLPHLRDRPVTLERLPDGVRPGAPHFWQKNTPDYYPKWIPRVEWPSGGESVRYALVHDLQSLLYLVNQGAITFHVGMARLDDLDRPDYLVFDLDRGAARFADVIAVAETLHAELKSDGIDSHPKTSGKTGLHIVVPWTGEGGFDKARGWAMEIAQRVEAALPMISTVERSKAKRGKRVYIDVMQNAPGKHAVPPYVVRAVPEATVSTPLAWREVGPRLDPKRFDLKSVLRRLSRQKRDPMLELVQH